MYIYVICTLMNEKCTCTEPLFLFYAVHLNKIELAIKIIKNKEPYREQSALETKMLRYIKSNDFDNESNIVKFNDYFIFRHHIVLYI